MEFRNIELIIINFLSQSVTQEELEILEIWMQYPGNELIFKEYVKAHFAITLSVNEVDLEEIKRKFREETLGPSPDRMRTKEKSFAVLHNKRFLKYAAICILFISLVYFVNRQSAYSDSIKNIAPIENTITLELNNGGVEIISLADTSKLISQAGSVIGVQRGSKLVYNENPSKEGLGHNVLKVPNGKQFSVELSDGTLIHLNAGSSIKYPVAFLPGKKRQIFLKGEAYFEVAHNQKSPFIVSAEELAVKVHGTTFNVSNYPEDESIEVVLLEGSVSMIDVENGVTFGNKVFLEPNFKGEFNRKGKSITKEKVNTAIYTAWRNGNLVFRELSFDKIIQKLERNYNITIINKNKKLGKETFNATIETKNETIEQVFEYFNKVHRIEYKVIGNKIVIN